MEAALRDMKNGTATGNDHTNIETLKAGEDWYLLMLSKSTLKTLAKLYTKCLSERRIRIPTAWKNAKMMIIFKREIRKTSRITDQYVYYQTSIYEVLTKVLTKRLEKTLDENQPREQALF